VLRGLPCRLTATALTSSGLRTRPPTAATALGPVAQLLHREADVEVEEVLAAHLAAVHAPQLLGAVVRFLYPQLAVDDRDPDSQAREHRLDELVGAG